MIPAGIYFLKVILCSTLLTGYYFVALRNKLFHQWNRFYLLIAVLLSLALPLVQFTIFHTPEEAEQSAIKLLNVVGGGGEEVVVFSSGSGVSLEDWAAYSYSTISILLLCGLFFSLIKISTLIRQHQAQRVQNILFINTEVKGTPFSFFRYIFWNKAIDIDSASGTQIFKHELVHVREWHTLDKLLMQVVLVLFWCNPVFWVIRYELKMIHEFIADKKAVQQQDASQLAALILQTVYPKNFAQIINPFFHHSIKRRLLMLTKIQSPRINYASRVFILPLVAFVVLAFSVRTKTIESNKIIDSVHKKFKVVVDAGHGGNDGGARSGNLYEKELTLAIAKQIKAMNSNENLEIFLTRTDDATSDLQNRVDIANNQKADLFLSIHVNAEPGNKTSGFEVFIQDNTSDYAQSKVLGSALLQSISSIYKTDAVLKQRAAGVYVLKQAPCPAVIIECGYLTNEQDSKFIQQPANQKAVAQKILAGIEMYLGADNKSSSPIDTIPPGVSINKNTKPLPDASDITEINVLAGKRMEVKLKDGSTHTYTENELRQLGLLDNASGPKFNKPDGRVAPQNMSMSGTVGLRGMDTTNHPLLIIEGEEYPWGAMNNIKSDDISSINILKDKSATAKWGVKGKNGVIEVTLKSDVARPSKVVPPNTKSNNSITFPKGMKVIASAEGDVTTIEPVYSLPEESNNHEVVVVAYRASDKPVYNSSIENDNYQQTFTKVETDPEFEGGMSAWRKYLERNLNSDVTVNNGAPKGNYTVIVQFIVEKDGSITDIKSLTKYGYGMEEEVIRVMKASPKWKPAIQNKNIVRAYKKQTVTFVVAENKGPATSSNFKNKLTVKQLQSMPFSKLLQPDTDHKMIGAIFTIDVNEKDLIEVVIKGDELSEAIRKLIAGTSAGKMITIDARKAITKEGKQVKLPALVYYII